MCNVVTITASIVAYTRHEAGLVGTARLWYFVKMSSPAGEICFSKKCLGHCTTYAFFLTFAMASCPIRPQVAPNSAADDPSRYRTILKRRFNEDRCSRAWHQDVLQAVEQWPSTPWLHVFQWIISNVFHPVAETPCSQDARPKQNGLERFGGTATRKGCLSMEALPAHNCHQQQRIVRKFWSNVCYLVSRGAGFNPSGRPRNMPNIHRKCEHAKLRTMEGTVLDNGPSNSFRMYSHQLFQRDRQEAFASHVCAPHLPISVPRQLRMCHARATCARGVLGSYEYSGAIKQTKLRAVCCVTLVSKTWQKLTIQSAKLS